MYSCGSLAPKMGKRRGGGGGCSDSKFQKPAEPWEFADGCVHLHAELTAIEAHRQQLARLLVQVSAIFYVKIRVNLSFVRTELGYKVGPRLRELAPRGQREPGGGIHAT